MEPVYTPVIKAVLLTYRLYGWRVQIGGAEHVPATGGGVVAGNHVSYLDFTFMGYGTYRQGRLLRFLAKKEIFDTPVVGALMRGMRHVEVDRFGDPTTSYRAAIKKLRAGEVVGMFPEGTISRSFVPAGFKTGAARMAIEAGVPLVPVANWGGQRLYTKGRKRSLRRDVPITLLFGPPVPHEPGDDAQAVTKRLRQAVGDLLEQAQRSYPDQPTSVSDGWWQPAHLGGSAPTVAEADEMIAQARAEKRARRRAELAADDGEPGPKRRRPRRSP